MMQICNNYLSCPNNNRVLSKTRQQKNALKPILGKGFSMVCQTAMWVGIVFNYFMFLKSDLKVGSGSKIRTFLNVCLVKLC